jgi:hypothetical protein
MAVRSYCSAAAIQNQSTGGTLGSAPLKRSSAGQNRSFSSDLLSRSITKSCCNALMLSERAPHSHAMRAHVDARSAVQSRAQAVRMLLSAKCNAAQRVAVN